MFWDYMMNMTVTRDLTTDGMIDELKLEIKRELELCEYVYLRLLYIQQPDNY
jgi:predicted DNA-binding ribbon-helix-helix protein